MTPYVQQAGKQFWDVSAGRTNPLNSIDLLEITPLAHQAAGIRISKLLTLSVHGNVLSIDCDPDLFNNDGPQE